MLKITDSTGETIGILEDEDTSPKMIEKKKIKETEEGEEDGTMGTATKVTTDSSETKTRD